MRRPAAGPVPPCRIPLLVLLALTAACDPADRPEAAPGAELVVRVDSAAGHPVVRSSGTLPSWRLADVADLGSVGGAGQRADDEFGSVTSVTVGPGGRLWVADATNAEIRVFRADGALERVVGRQGEGPGEFGSLYSVAWAGDTLLALDFGNGRIAEISPDGEWLGGRRAPGRVSGSAAMLRLYPVGPAEVYQWSLRTEPAFQRVWVRHGPGGALGETPQPDVEAPEGRYVRCVAEGVISSHANPWAPAAFQHPAPGGRLWIGTSDRYRLALVDSAGDTIRVVERDVPLAPLADEEWAEADGEYEEWRGRWTEMAGECTGEWTRPGTKPAFRNVMVDTSGRLWVERFVEAGTLWEVFDGDGRPLGAVPGFEYTDRSAPHLSEGDVAWVTRDTLLGVSRVHWRRVER